MQQKIILGKKNVTKERKGGRNLRLGAATDTLEGEVRHGFVDNQDCERFH